MNDKYEGMQYNDSALIEHYRDMIKDHYLVVLKESGEMCHYQLRRKPDSRYYVTDISYLPHVGVILSGDLHPQSEFGGSIGKCDVELFSAKCYPNYIASKFLPDNIFCASRAEVELRDIIVDLKDALDCDIGGSYKDLEALQKMFNYHFGDITEFVTEFEFVHDVYEHMYDFFSDGGAPGYGYDRNDYALLVAIQEKFSELYAEHSARVALGLDWKDKYTSKKGE